MQVAEAVAVRRLYDEGEDGAPRGLGGGYEMEGVAKQGRGPALTGLIRTNVELIWRVRSRRHKDMG